jgi:Ca-activated chloride channel family protein
MFNNIEFASPAFLYLLLIIPLLTVWYVWKGLRNYGDVRVADSNAFGSTPSGYRHYIFHGLFVLRMFALAALIVALARPQSSSKGQNVTIEGIDVVTALDVSGSMLAEDFKPNRLEAAKLVAGDFIAGRPNDRIGLVIFSGESFTQCPLTTDHSVVEALMKDVKSGVLEDGTAIGDGLATAVNRLRESMAISKVIILLTDGENNRGSVDPLSAAEIAKLYGVRVYTIGVGTNGMAPMPARDIFGRKTYQQVEVRIDEETLKQIADITGGTYFRATGNNSLKEIFEEIDQMEKSKIDVTDFQVKSEEFFPLVLLALMLLALEFLLRSTVLKMLP